MCIDLVGLQVKVKIGVRVGSSQLEAWSVGPRSSMEDSLLVVRNVQTKITFQNVEMRFTNK